MSNNDCRDAFATLQGKASRDRWYDKQKHYIFEVDSDYLPELHKRDDDYPFAPETINIDAEIRGE